VRILDEEGHPAAEGTLGELQIRGPSLMRGYFRDPMGTSTTISEGWLRTGDQGYFRMHGGRAMYFITGRIKEIIIRSGEKFSPVAIEKKICEEVPEAAGRLVVLGFPHSGYGEEVGAYLEDSASSELRERLLTAIRALPLEMRPKILLYGSHPIPRTHTGKVQRRKLQSLFAPYVDCRGQTKAVAV
jgi:long-chain acyl-CoA synthetase